MAESNQQDQLSTLPKNRLEGLCDAIFAITMTLMILDFKAPDIPADKINPQLFSNLMFNLISPLEVYVASFVLLGIFWIKHQIQLKYIDSADMGLLIINIFFLMIIGFVPFTVRMMREYKTFDLTFMIYAINLLLISLMLLLQWYYVIKKANVIACNVSDEMKKRFLTASLIPIFIFIAAFFVSFYSTRIALFIVYLDPVYFIFFRKKIMEQT